MPKYCNVVVYFIDGRVEEFYGGLHVDEKVLRIWPRSGGSVVLPLKNIRKFLIT